MVFIMLRKSFSVSSVCSVDFFLGWADRHHRTYLLTRFLGVNAHEYIAFGEGFIIDRIGDARIFGAARAENKSKNLFFAESREK